MYAGLLTWQDVLRSDAVWGLCQLASALAGRPATPSLPAIAALVWCRAYAATFPVKAANRVVVVFDACRRHEPLAGCLMDVHSIGNALVVYSCAPGSLAFDGFLDGQGYLTHLIEVRICRSASPG